jgi:hypothetical protein
MSKNSKSKKNSATLATPTTAPTVDKPLDANVYLIRILLGLVIVAAATWIYFPILHGGWLMDDNAYVTQNPGLRDPAGLLNIWLAPGSFVEYYPIEESVLWIIWQFSHNDSFAYHVVTLICHIIGSLLVWRFFTKLNLKYAWLGGLIFAIHPVQVESVAWVAELKNTLSAPPFLLAMCYWVDFEKRGRDQDYMLALLWFLVAMLCKITMAPFPIIMLIYAWWRRGTINWIDLQRTIPFFVISLVLGMTTIFVGDYYAPGHVLKIHMGTEELDFWGLLALNGLTTSFYFLQVFLPIQMLPAYPQWPINPLTLEKFLPIPIILAVLAWAWIRRKTWGKHFLLGFGFFILILAPFLGFHGVSYMRFTWVMDHFLYLPMIGLLAVALAGVEELDKRYFSSDGYYGLIGVLALITITLFIESSIYAKKFKSLETVWSYEIQHYPDAWLAHNNLGYEYVEQNRLDEARDQFIEALRIKPDYSEAFNNLGVVYSRTGHIDEAIHQYEQALKVNPDYGDAESNLNKLKAVKQQMLQRHMTPKVLTAPE